MGAVPNHFGRQRYVGGNDEVAAPGTLHDLVVRDIEPRV